MWATRASDSSTRSSVLWRESGGRILVSVLPMMRLTFISARRIGPTRLVREVPGEHDENDENDTALACNPCLPQLLCRLSGSRRDQISETAFSRSSSRSKRIRASCGSTEWIETTVISYKNEEKSSTQQRCYYGADGNLQKVPVASSQAEMPGGLKGRAAKRKKEDVTEYMQRAAALIHQYVPPNPATLQTTFQSGRVAAQILEPGRRNRLDFKSYLLPGDVLGVEVNMTNNKILALSVASYLDKPEDTVNLTVQFAALTDGTGYPAQITLDATKQQVRVVTRNSGYRPVQR